MIMKAKSKAERLRGATYAEGGPANAMFGEQAAGQAKAGRTGKTQSPAPGLKSAKGGPPTTGRSMSQPSRPGRTGAALEQKRGR
jgi:hypothetical protein